MILAQTLGVMHATRFQKWRGWQDRGMRGEFLDSKYHTYDVITKTNQFLYPRTNNGWHTG